MKESDGVVLLLEPGQQLVERLCRLDERALRWKSRQEIEWAHRLGQGSARRKRAFEKPRRALACRGHVDVRIRAIRVESVRVLDHRPRHVGVQVEACDYRHARPDDLAHARQQFTFAIVEMFGDHRAMQIQIDAVDRAGLAQAFQHVADDALVRVAGNLRRRRRRTPHQAQRAVARGVQRIEGAGGRNVGAGQARRDRVAIGYFGPAPTVFERGIIGLRGRKRIGFVLESAYRDDSHPKLPWGIRAGEVSRYRPRSPNRCRASADLPGEVP